MSFEFGDVFSEGGFTGPESVVPAASVPELPSTVDAVQVPDASDVMGAVASWSWTRDKVLYAVAALAAVAVGVYFITDFVRAKNAHTHETQASGD